MWFDFSSGNGYIDNILDEIEEMGDFCDLYKKVYRNFKPEDLNSIHEPLPSNERNSSILYASDLINLE